MVIESIFIIPLQPRGAALKERCRLNLIGGNGLPGFSPFGPVFDDPIGQGSFEADVPTGFFGLNPFVPQNLFALGLEFAVKRGILQQVVCLSRFFSVVRHIKTKVSLWNESLDRVAACDNLNLQRFVRFYHHVILTVFTGNLHQTP